MFDTYQNGPPQSVTVTKHEYRAPTDDSARLLREMEDRAMARVIEVATVGTNVMTGRVVRVMSTLSMDTEYRCLFDLNGTKYAVPVTIDPRAALTDNDHLRLVYEAMAKAIAEKMLLNVLTTGGRL